MRWVAIVGVAVVALVALGLGGCVSVITGAVGGSTPPAGSTTTSTPTATTTGPSTTRPNAAAPAVPLAWEALDQTAASTCAGLDWSLLAAIGRVESDSGRSGAPGVRSGTNPAGAEGPMQFEPATFAEYAVVGPGGATPPSPYDPVDAVYTAAHLLCANGAGASGGTYLAVWDYNHSTLYVATVLVLGVALAADPALLDIQATALAFAAEQLGAPYLWGGSGPGGWDCSGLVQAAYRSAGVTLPRVAQTQLDAGPALPPGTPPEPGDLLFFGTSARNADHVGIYVGGGSMIDAPFTGTVVRVDATPIVIGASVGTAQLVGITQP